MDFFLYQVLARVVAGYLAYDCARQLWIGMGEGKMRSFQPDVLNWIFDWSRSVFDRETMPVRFWIEVTIQAVSLVCCLFVLIFGWWHPSA